MAIVRERRTSDSDLVQWVTRGTYVASAIADVTVPDGCWDFVFRIRRGRTEVRQTGMVSRPIVLDAEPGDTYVGIAFKADVYMPRRPQRETVFWPETGPRATLIASQRFEIPTFENAEDFATALVRHGVIVRDPIVRDAMAGKPTIATDRTVQRHFANVTGMTWKSLRQIQRANRAVALLAAGRRPAEVAMELGYADQSHMTNSMRRIVGLTPGQVALRDR
jgi:hypothetical protein